MFTNGFTPRAFISSSFARSRNTHSMTYSRQSSAILSRPRSLTRLSSSLFRSSEAGKVMRSVFFPVKSSLSCVGIGTYLQNKKLPGPAWAKELRFVFRCSIYINLRKRNSAKSVKKSTGFSLIRKKAKNFNLRDYLEFVFFTHTPASQPPQSRSRYGRAY